MKRVRVGFVVKSAYSRLTAGDTQQQPMRYPCVYKCGSDRLKTVLDQSRDSQSLLRLLPQSSYSSLFYLSIRRYKIIIMKCKPMIMRYKLVIPQKMLVFLHNYVVFISQFVNVTGSFLALSAATLR